MLEITPDDVALLNDADLRTLIGLLCESELRSRGLSAAAVTWSGDQNAADGGLDVRVALAEGETIEGFVPRPQTGFQVKKSPMPRAEILDEMRPKGVLRPIIRDLANRSGAYIVASAESASEMALRNRRDAMREALNDLPNAKDLALDFYDRGRVASWVRDHAGMVLWVRSKIGRPLPGWRSYEAWSYAPDGIKGEYLLDDAVRIRTDTETTEPGLSPAARAFNAFVIDCVTPVVSSGSSDCREWEKRDLCKPCSTAALASRALIRPWHFTQTWPTDRTPRLQLLFRI